MLHVTFAVYEFKFSILIPVVVYCAAALVLCHLRKMNYSY